jgi:hypothetical protein
VHIKNDELLGAIWDIREKKKEEGGGGDKGRGFCSIWNLAQGQFTLVRSNSLLRKKLSSNNEKNHIFMFLTQYIFIKQNYVIHVLKFHFSSDP